MVFFLFSASAITIAIVSVWVQCIGEKLAEREIELSEDVARIVMAACGCAVFIGDTISVRLDEKLNGTLESDYGEHSDRHEETVISDTIDKRCSESFDYVIGNGIYAAAAISEGALSLDNFRVKAHRLRHLDDCYGKR